HHASILALFPELPPPAPPRAEPGLMTLVKTRLSGALEALFPLSETIMDTLGAAGRAIVLHKRTRIASVREQMVVLGVDAAPMVALMSFLTGLILAFQ